MHAGAKASAGEPIGPVQANPSRRRSDARGRRGHRTACCRKEAGHDPRVVCLFVQGPVYVTEAAAAAMVAWGGGILVRTEDASGPPRVHKGGGGLI